MGPNLREVAKVYTQKLSKIKVALFDVDGVLTDGKLFYMGEEVGWNRCFHTHDGYGLKMLKKAGLKVGVISGGASLGVEKRFSMLGLDYIYLGNEDKRKAYQDILKKSKVRDDEVLYMGDEFFDLPILKRVGFSATVPHASHEIQEVVDYVSYRSGGEACAREVIDMLRYVQGITPEIDDFNTFLPNPA